MVPITEYKYCFLFEEVRERLNDARRDPGRLNDVEETVLTIMSVVRKEDLNDWQTAGERFECRRRIHYRQIAMEGFQTGRV